MKKISYYKLSNANPKGGLVINDSEGLSSIIGDLVQKIGSNFLKGNFNVLKLRKPIRLYCPATMLNSLTFDLHYTDIINKAADKTDPMERIRLVIVFLIAGIYTFPFTYRSKAPLEPILGETYQAYKSDGTQAYIEQVGPDSSNFLIIGPESKYKIYGCSTIKAEMNGMNGVKGLRTGRNFIEFKDGTIIEYKVPQLVIDGLVMGDRILNYDGSFTVIDSKNGLIGEAKFSYNNENINQPKEESFGSKFFGFFSKKEEIVPSDTIVFTIKDNSDKIVSEGNGAWTGQIYFSGKRYWSFDDDYENWEQEKIDFILPSDSMIRKDVIALKKPDNYKEAAAANEELLNMQRDDQFFRDQYKK